MPVIVYSSSDWSSPRSFYISRRLNHRTITVCHFISDYNAVRRLPVFWTTTVPRHVIIVALGVHVVVVLTRAPFPNKATTQTRPPRRRWSTSKLTDASMKFQLQTVNNVHFFIEAASIKLREVKGVRLSYRRIFVGSKSRTARPKNPESISSFLSHNRGSFNRALTQYILKNYSSICVSS